MELFVVNRHTGDPVEGETSHNDEEAKLDRLRKRIERNRKMRQKYKEKETRMKAIKVKAIEERSIKRQKKEKIVTLPVQQDDFVDTEIKLENGSNRDDEIGDGDVLNKKKVKKRKIIGTEDVDGFTILGGESFDKSSKVKRVLPGWLSNPTVIPVNLQDLDTKVSSMKTLQKSLRKKLREAGVHYLFPVQVQVIPWLLSVNADVNHLAAPDVCVSAPTGSGKTLAYTLPIIQSLMNKHLTRAVRALILLPTQDLARQVFTCMKTYAQVDCRLKVALITGKNVFATEQAQLVIEDTTFAYISGADILVCTPGRLVDHLKYTVGFTLRYLEFLVIDEADRVLDSVQTDWLYHLERHIYGENSTSMKLLNLRTLHSNRTPQKLLFSATLSQDPEKLQKLSLFQPKLFTCVVEQNGVGKMETVTDSFIGKFTTPRELTEKYITITSNDLRPLSLYKFIQDAGVTRILVFADSVEAVHRLAILLQSLCKSSNLAVREVTSKLTPQAHVELMQQFSEGKIDILVCTDTLARGIDLPAVACVINYTVPKYIKTYIHRAGRTARAGEDGLVVTIMLEKEFSRFDDMMRRVSKTNLEKIDIPDDDLQVLEKEYVAALQDLKSEVGKEELVDMLKVKHAKYINNSNTKRFNKKK